MAFTNITDTTKFKTWISTINDIMSKLIPVSRIADGFMLKEDKAKLDDIEERANRTDIDDLVIASNSNIRQTVINGNTGDSFTIDFIGGEGVTIDADFNDNSATYKLKSKEYEVAKGATEAEDGIKGLVDPVMGTPHRMLFSTMEWKEADQVILGNSNYPVSSKAVYDALVTKAPVSHATSETTYGIGDAYNYGHIKLSDFYGEEDSTSGTAVTPKALKDVNDTLLEVQEIANSNTIELNKMNARLSTVYRYMGTVDSYDDLLLIENPSVGDVYNTRSPLYADGPNYAWNGFSWDNLGETIAVDTISIENSTNPISSGYIHELESKIAPQDHASDTTEYGLGTVTAYGHLKLSDSITYDSDINGGTAATPKAVSLLNEEIAKMKDSLNVADSLSFFHDANEAVIPDVYADPEAKSSIPSKIAFAELNTVVNELTDRVEQIDINMASKNGDTFNETMVFSKGIFSDILALDDTKAELEIDPNQSTNFSLNCTEREYTISISDITSPSATFVLMLKGASNSEIIWPDNVRWSNDMEASLSEGIDILKFYTIDGGENWFVVHELSNANSSITTYAIIGDSEGYFYRISPTMIRKLKLKVPGKIISSASNNEGYMLLVEYNGERKIYSYENESFSELDFSFSNTTTKLFSGGADFYAVSNNDIYKFGVDGTSTLIINDTNVIIDGYASPYGVVFYITEDDTSYWFNVSGYTWSEEKAGLMIYNSYVDLEKGNIYVCFGQNGFMRVTYIPELSRYTIEKVRSCECYAITKYTPSKYILYGCGGLSLLEYINQGKFKISNYMYIDTSFIPHDMKFTNVGIVISGTGGKEYLDQFGNSEKYLDVDRDLPDFYMVNIPYANRNNNYTGQDILALDFDRSNIKKYKNPYNEASTNDIATQYQYVPVHDPSIASDVFAECYLIQGTKSKVMRLDKLSDELFSTTNISINDNKSFIYNTTYPMSNEKLIDVALIEKISTEQKKYFMVYENGYIVDNIRDTLFSSTKFEFDTEDDQWAKCVSFYEEEEDIQHICVVSKHGKILLYDFEEYTWYSSIPNIVFSAGEEEDIVPDDVLLFMLGEFGSMMGYVIHEGKIYKVRYDTVEERWIASAVDLDVITRFSSTGKTYINDSEQMMTVNLKRENADENVIEKKINANFAFLVDVSTGNNISDAQEQIRTLFNEIQQKYAGNKGNINILLLGFHSYTTQAVSVNINDINAWTKLSNALDDIAGTSKISSSREQTVYDAAMNGSNHELAYNYANGWFAEFDDANIINKTYMISSNQASSHIVQGDVFDNLFYTTPDGKLQTFSHGGVFDKLNADITNGIRYVDGTIYCDSYKLGKELMLKANGIEYARINADGMLEIVGDTSSWVDGELQPGKDDGSIFVSGVPTPLTLRYDSNNKTWTLCGVGGTFNSESEKPYNDSHSKLAYTDLVENVRTSVVIVGSNNDIGNYANSGYRENISDIISTLPEPTYEDNVSNEQSNIYFTTDDGETWSRVSNPLSVGRKIVDIEYIDGIYYLLYDRGYIVSFDGFKFKLSLNAHPIVNFTCFIKFEDIKELFAASKEGIIFRFDNKKRTWNVFSSSTFGVDMAIER